MRIALHSVIRPGHETAYEVEHERIPAALAARFTELGIHDWTIWRSGADLFHFIECDDFAAALTGLADDPANRAWQDTINVHVDHFVPAGPTLEPLAQVWRLEHQLTTTPDPEKS